MEQRNRAKDWLQQAKWDIRYAKAALADQFYSQTCFICQQAAEKALKSMLYYKGAEKILTHSLHQLCETLRVNSRLLNAAKVLDLYYISARYPDALAAGTPHEVFTKDQAKEAIRFAQMFVRKAERSRK